MKLIIGDKGQLPLAVPYDFDYSGMVGTPYAVPPGESNISDVDLTDTEHCILCYNDLKIFGMGACEHKHVCHTCTLRLRLIIENKFCPICMTELGELIITKDRALTWEVVQRDKDTYIRDIDDETILYDDKLSQREGMRLRALNCLFPECDKTYFFKDLEQLKKHYEMKHQKTFCKICMQGRLVFQKE